MKAPFSSVRAAFTLIEMIGVLAIMSILAAVIAPNVVHTIDLAEARAEGQTLSNFAAQLKVYVGNTAILPTAATWSTVLQKYVDEPATSITTNHRARARVYLTDPVASNQRAILLSVESANAILALPVQANMTTAAFQTLWDTNYNTVPTTASGGWSGWGAWDTTTMPACGQFLVIQRINFTPDLQTFAFTINNKSVTANYSVKCIVTHANGAPVTPYTLTQTNPAGSAISQSFTGQRGDRFDFYFPATAIVATYSYVVSNTGKTFDFKDDVKWLPQ